MELGVPSDIQTAYKILWSKCELSFTLTYSVRMLLKYCEGFTISGDATTNRNVNKEAQHTLIVLPSGEGKPPVAKNCLLGVHVTVDHTSETQVHGWVSKFKQLVVAFNGSPFSQRIGERVDLETFALKVRGTAVTMRPTS